MQYHLTGFRTGDPSVTPAKDGNKRDAVDVLIVGCGPAGLTLATQLAAFADITVRIIEGKSGPLEVGQADGIACRSMEMFEAFGFADRVMREGYHVNEVSFWRPRGQDTMLERADRVQDVPDDLSEMPHIILSQARIHDFYLDIMVKSASRLTPDYGRRLVKLDRDDDQEFPVEATVVRSDAVGETETIRAKYVVGCDGARSTVRSQLGFDLKGQSARQLWGVMDVLAVTNFPDIRLKCAIQSATAGSLLVIPREGGYMVRLYIELDALGAGERAINRKVTQDQLIAQACAILSPFEFEVKEVAWWSAYEIGQRVCDSFDDNARAGGAKNVPRIFIAGDACHTHSPKAGQGMNVSMADAFNLGWKLAAVLRGQSPDALLETYSAERHAKAKELIDFDRDMARLFSEKTKTDADAARFQSYFKKHGRYTAGVETCYAPSLITGIPCHQELAKGYPIGKRFHSTSVVRQADAKPMQLGHVLKADGRWRIIAFAPEADGGAAKGALGRLCNGVEKLLRRVTAHGDDIDAVIDFRAVFPLSHSDVDTALLPDVLLPRKGPLKLVDYEKVFCADQTIGNIYERRGIDPKHGAVLVVRPDQYVSLVVPIDGIDAIATFFEMIMPR